ncbi:hypothetical protein Fleli_2067 [Bernardetia litoralis DSM 6794]|uniref:Lipoprotein n=1 Tax=Bernardetia litoralis (strain ATCC 23117 / DSM 6794 / NBRC 15988 / NCIMB 1366 / Fx l1 / Sio-4) TaxID=880071 RepID=I4AKG5_BERLS|nr:hypothetical protein [Bernardetia litoralis]AFM04450.1 hypothetical protein Fleli_2067 [Bernardetia litoralis DSM 6794]
MRYLFSYIYIFLFSVVLIGFYSCTNSKTEEKNTVALAAVNWNDTTTMGKVINDYYKDSVFKAGKIAMKIRDPFINSKLPYQHLQLHKVLRPQFKRASSTIGYMPVLMMGLSDSAIVDFQITWTQIAPTDSTGKFVVTDVFLQRIGKEFRYEWVKEEEYWIRKNIEMSEENRKNEKRQKIDPKRLKKVQENNVIQ